MQAAGSGDQAVPEWSKAVKPATSEAARSSIRGHGCTLSGWPSPWERRAAQIRRVRLREAQEPSWGAAKTALCPCWRAGGAEGVGVRAEVQHEGEHRDDLSHRGVELADAEIRPARRSVVW